MSANEAFERLTKLRLGRRAGKVVPYKVFTMLAVLGLFVRNFESRANGLLWEELEPRMRQLHTALVPLSPRPAQLIDVVYALEGDGALVVVPTDATMTLSQWVSMRLRDVLYKKVRVHLLDWVRAAIPDGETLSRAAEQLVETHLELLNAYRPAEDAATAEQLLAVWRETLELDPPGQAVQ